MGQTWDPSAGQLLGQAALKGSMLGSISPQWSASGTLTISSSGWFLCKRTVMLEGVCAAGAGVCCTRACQRGRPDCNQQHQHSCRCVLIGYASIQSTRQPALKFVLWSIRCCEHAAKLRIRTLPRDLNRLRLCSMFCTQSMC
jgi:hypothetical protein